MIKWLIVIVVLAFVPSVQALPFYNVTLESPSNGIATTDNTPDFVFNYSGMNDTASCEVFVDGTGYGINSSTNNITSTTITANASISDGTYYWVVNCTNSTTQQSDQNWSITIDTTPPQIVITSPINITYSDSAPLEWSADETTNWSGYAVVGNVNTTLSGNITLNLSDYYYQDYQEDADSSTVLGSCAIGYECAKMHDGNWDIAARSTGITPPYYMDNRYNYTKPTNAVNATWKVKTAIAGTVDYAITADCWDQDPLQFKGYGRSNPSAYVSWHCWDGSDWYTIGSESAFYIYEEAITWNMSLVDGYVNATVHANDTLGNMNSSTVYFSVDTTAPALSNPDYPAGQNEGTSFPVSGTFTDTYSTVDAVLVDWNNANHTTTNVTSLYSTTLNTPLVNQNTFYNLTFYYNDTLGNQESTTYQVEVMEIAGSGPPDGGGGGGGDGIIPQYPEVQSGTFTIYTTALGDKIEQFGTAGVEMPEITVYVTNGNITQNFGSYFSDELWPYCRMTEIQGGAVPPGSQTLFKFICRATGEVIYGNFIVTTDTGNEGSVPVVIGPSIGFLQQSGDFIRLVVTGDWDSFLIHYHGWPVAIIVTFIIIVFGLLVWWYSS
jgi:hypothetical protein